MNRIKWIPLLFFEFDLLDLKDSEIIELEKFKKDKFDLENIFSTASELKYTSKIKSLLTEIWEEPNEEFVSFVLAHVYEGRKTKKYSQPIFSNR